MNSLDSFRKNRIRGKSGDSLKSGLIIGPSGVGKTTTVRRYVEKTKQCIPINELGIEIDTSPVVYLEVPVPFSIKGFFISVLHSFGISPLPYNQTNKHLKGQILKIINDHKVEMLILDEMQSILLSKFVKPIKAMEVISELGKEAGILLVFVATPEFYYYSSKTDQNYNLICGLITY